MARSTKITEEDDLTAERKMASKMTIREAKDIVREYRDRSAMSADEEFLYIEALEFLIEATKKTRWMVELGGYYYEEKKFDLALKYYEMADAYGDRWAPMGLGYIWYYGRTGEKDYKKAFEYYSRGAKNGYVQGYIKIADMYKNGYYVEKDFAKYAETVEEAYPQVSGSDDCFDPISEVCTRLARIRTQQGRNEEAAELYEEARECLAERLSINCFFGDLTVMKSTVEDLYALRGSTEEEPDLYDLYVLLQKPVRVRFRLEDETHEVAAVPEEDGSLAICLDGKWFRTIDDFFQKGQIGGDRLPVLYYEMEGFEVIPDGSNR
ncbi:MAG: sel1 repeat family protein [Firmicutes bacterium]|nr:sel1 repeat family protein [Bacillota bacterium]